MTAYLCCSVLAKGTKKKKRKEFKRLSASLPVRVLTQTDEHRTGRQLKELFAE
jgi:transcriptional regulator of met regulon